MAATLALILAIGAGGPAVARPVANTAASALSTAKKALRISKRANRRAKRADRRSKRVSAQSGPRGPQGPKGDTGPSTGPAGGDLTGNYPNPTLASDSVGDDQLADSAVSAAKVGVRPLVQVINFDLDQAIDNNKETPLLFDAPESSLYNFDSDDLYDPGVPGVFTVATAGVYELSATVEWAADSSGTRQLWLKNVYTRGETTGTIDTVVARTGAPSTQFTQTGSMLFRAEPGDELTVRVKQTSGDTLSVLHTWARAVWVGPVS